MKKDELISEHPLFVVDERVWQAVGAEGVDVIRATSAAWAAPKGLVLAVKRFMARIAKQMLPDALVKEAGDLWLEGLGGGNILTKKEEVATTTISPKSSEMIAWMAFLRTICLNLKGSSQFCGHSLDVKLTELVAAYVLMECSSRRESALMNWLQAKGMYRRPAKELSKMAIPLAAKIENFVAVKMPVHDVPNEEYRSGFAKKKITGGAVEKGVSVFKLSKQMNSILFWHREFARRRFYLDFESDPELRFDILSILEYLKKVFLRRVSSSFECYNCCLLNKDIFFSNFYSNSINLESDLCEDCFITTLICSIDSRCSNGEVGVGVINFSCVNSHIESILSRLHHKYGYNFVDLLKRCSADYIARYKVKYKCIPVYVDFCRKVIGSNVLKSGFVGYKSDSDYRKFAKGVKSRLVHDRYVCYDDANIVGVFIWDMLNCSDVQKKTSISSVIVQCVECCDWYALLPENRKFSKKIEDYKSKKGIGYKDFIDDAIAQYRGEYCRVDESIRSGKLLSKKEAHNKRKGAE